MVSLDGVGPIDNRPFTNKLHQLNKYNKSLRLKKNIYLWKKKKRKICDMWHITCDRWWALCQYFRSLALMVWELWSFEDLKEKDDLLYQSMTKVFVEEPCYTGSGKYRINQSVTLHVRRPPNNCRQEILGRLTWLRHSSCPPSFVSSVIIIVFQCSRRPSIFRHWARFLLRY